MEIDFLGVGKDSSKSGDAIALRFGNLFGPRSEWGVVVVDGGHSTTGDEMAEHILEVYGTSHIELMVSTHPDNDHINGLITLMERDDITVGELWIHQPWRHNKLALLTSYIADRTKAEEKSFDAYIANAKKLYDLAVEHNIPVEEPFATMRRDVPGYTLCVVAPDEAFYSSLVGDFGTKSASGFASTLLRKVADAALQKAEETRWLELLTDGGTTTAANNSSVILLLADDQQQRCLLTGDAGMPALERAIDELAAVGVLTGDLNLVQVPHHGSRHNVGPTVLDQLLGPKGGSDQGVAVCSAAAEGAPRHPAKMVTNAFDRRGYPVHATRGNQKWYLIDSPRPMGGLSVPEPFHAQVETFDD